MDLIVSSSLESHLIPIIVGSGAISFYLHCDRSDHLEAGSQVIIRRVEFEI